MPLPHAEPWNLLDLHDGTFAELGGASGSDVVVSPEGAGHVRISTDLTRLEVRADDDARSTYGFGLSVPARYTLQVVLRARALPHNLGDLETRHFGVTLADDAGRGLSLFFAKTGIALGHIDTYGAVTALPDTADFTRAVSTAFFTLRIAVDGALGRAYVFASEGETDTPALRWILPVDDTPEAVGDLVRLEVRGTSAEPIDVELKQVRFAAGLVLADYPPVADPGQDRVAVAGQAVRLDGRASYDIEGAPLSFRWRCLDAPTDSTFAAELSHVTFADDGDGVATRLLAGAALPDWLTTGDVLRIEGGVHEVLSVEHATGRLDLLHALAIPAGTPPVRIIRQSILLEPRAPAPAAAPDVPGLYRFALTVSDGSAYSEPAEVLVSVVPLQTPTGVEPDLAILWKALGDEWRLIDGRDVFQEVWTGVAQILAGKLLEAWQHHYNTSIRDAQRVFQRKWVAFRTFEPDTAPAQSTVSARHGALMATTDFSLGMPALTGLVLSVEALTATGDRNADLFFQGVSSLAEVVGTLNTWLSDNGLPAVAEVRQLRSLQGAERLFLRAAVPMRVSGTAAHALGLPVAQWNRLEGGGGRRITDRTYYAEGVDLVAAGVQRGDLLVVNRGQTLRIDRVLSDPSDPHPNQRLLLFDLVPVDATATWSIPSVLRSAEVDYERAGAYPGDLAKTEILAASSSEVIEDRALVVGQRGTQLAAHLEEATLRALMRGDEVRFIGLKRRKAIPLPGPIVGVPTLQELVAAKLEPVRLREHVDYILAPFYRDEGARPLGMLQLRDDVYIVPDTEPPDVLWAETALFDNEKNVENLFGRLVGFLRDDAASFPKDFNYVAGVAGLLYAQQRGPTLFAMSVGAQILFGQPFAEIAGYVEEIRENYSPRKGRILLRDDDGNQPSESDTIRAYYWTKNPSDTSAYSGLAINPETGFPWRVGERVPQFSTLGAGIELDDIYTKPAWWKPYAGGGAMHEIEKFKRFVCTFDLKVVDLANISLLSALLTRIKPKYTQLMLIGQTGTFDDLDIDDVLDQTVTIQPYDSPMAARGYRYDDYLGSGETSSHYDDGVTRHDALYDAIVDTLAFRITLAWPGGSLALPSTTWPLSVDRDLVDLDGAQTGSAGATFRPTHGMTLAAGTYQTDVVAKAGPILSPLS